MSVSPDQTADTCIFLHLQCQAERPGKTCTDWDILQGRSCKFKDTQTLHSNFSAIPVLGAVASSYWTVMLVPEKTDYNTGKHGKDLEIRIETENVNSLKASG